MYPWTISGITGKIPGKFAFTEEANEQTMRQLVDDLPPEVTVGFYDKDYPSPSDPGAFVLFQRDNDKYIKQQANHGWSTQWESVTVEGLVAYLLQCKKYNMGLDGYEGMYFASPPPKQKKTETKKKWWEFWK
jgi:hypothetical protein